MIKQPQNIIKISSQHTNGDYSQMVFDASLLTQKEMEERFRNFLYSIGYTDCEKDPL
jgi:hypothetical protein